MSAEGAKPKTFWVESLRQKDGADKSFKIYLCLYVKSGAVELFSIGYSYFTGGI